MLGIRGREKLPIIPVPTAASLLSGRCEPEEVAVEGAMAEGASSRSSAVEGSSVDPEERSAAG